MTLLSRRLAKLEGRYDVGSEPIVHVINFVDVDGTVKSATVDRGIRGEKNALVELTAGLHYIEYYHEEVTLDQMAYLGWRPSEDKGQFFPIPETVYTAPHAGAVARYWAWDPKAGPTL